MTAATWTGLLIAWIAAIASPGPDTLLLMRLGVRERRSAVLAAQGIMTGNTLWILFSVLGISAVLAAFPWLLPLLQCAGSAVLLWLGVQALRTGIRGLRGTAGAAEGGPPSRPYLLGLTTNIANPKALIFFTALLSQFLPVSATVLDRGAVIAAMILIGLCWFTGVALACSAAAFRRWLRRATPGLDIAAGIVFIAVAGIVLGELVIGSTTVTSLR